MLAMWRNDKHVIFWLLFAIHFHLTVSSDVVHLSSTLMDYVGLTKDNALSIFEEMFVQIKEYTKLKKKANYESWNFNSGNYLFTTDTK